MIWYDMIYDMTWHDMTWYDMVWHDMTWHDMTWYDMIWYDIIWYDMIWYDMIWYDMTWHCMVRNDVWYDMIWYILLTAVGLTPGGSSTVHIYTRTVHRTTQLTARTTQLTTRTTQLKPNWEEYGMCPIFASYTLAFALQLRKKHGKTSVRIAEECQLARWKRYMRNRNRIYRTENASNYEIMSLTVGQ